MQIVIVEDRPWKMEKSIGMMRNKGISVGTVVYVSQSIEEVDSAIMHKMEELSKDIGDLDIKITDDKHFVDDMKEYYKDRNNIILCDFNLTGSRREFFEKRVNIIFVRDIMKEANLENPPKRVLFYTTAGEATNEQINRAFPGCNISVERIEEDQVILDVEELERIVEQGE